MACSSRDAAVGGVGAEPAGGGEALRRGGPRAARRLAVGQLDERGGQLVVVPVGGLDAVAQRHRGVVGRARSGAVQRGAGRGRDPLVDRRRA